MKPIKFVACGDIHGDEQDAPSVKALLAFTKEYIGKDGGLVVCIGDLWDFRAIRKGAGDEEQASSLQKDWDCGEEFIREFFKFGDERIFLRGNHDERIFDMARNSRSGLARDYANDGIENIELIMKETKARMFPYDSVGGIYKCGSLSFVHGYGHAMHSGKQHADAYGDVIFGHTTPSTILEASPSTLELATISDASATRLRNIIEANSADSAGNTAGRSERSIPIRRTKFFKHGRGATSFIYPPT